VPQSFPLIRSIYKSGMVGDVLKNVLQQSYSLIPLFFNYMLCLVLMLNCVLLYGSFGWNCIFGM
jgi:hypothetical protein